MAHLTLTSVSHASSDSAGFSVAVNALLRDHLGRRCCRAMSMFLFMCDAASIKFFFFLIKIVMYYAVLSYTNYAVLSYTNFAILLDDPYLALLLCMMLHCTM